MSIHKEREDYVNNIKRLLAGPGSETFGNDFEYEIITSKPELRYPIGVLYCRDLEQQFSQNDVEVENNFEEGKSSECTKKDIKQDQKDDVNIIEDLTEDEIVSATKYYPSSMGISFLVQGNSENINCQVNFATYRKILPQECIFLLNDLSIEPKIPNDLKETLHYQKDTNSFSLKKYVTYKEIKSIQSGNTDLVIDYPSILEQLFNQSKSFKRIPHVCDITLRFDNKNYIDSNQNLSNTYAKITSFRKKMNNGITSITIMLVNNSSISKSENFIFQPEIIVSTHNNSFRFVDFSLSKNFDILSEEELSLELQYRNKKIYGTGLGTACDWNINSKGLGLLKSDFFPQYEVPSSNFNLPLNTKTTKNILSMKSLSSLSKIQKQEIISELRLFVTDYSDWINIQNKNVDYVDLHFRDIAKINIRGCTKARDRMLNGINLLENNDTAWESFQLANQAMFMQRVHLTMQDTLSNKERLFNDVEIKEWFEQLNYESENDSHHWRPFQLAFLLLSIESIVNPNSKDRNITDLIWFPTGGGKTEAYLGLTAFTLFFRRLNNLKISSGTAVIMRYTLRLLTAQQFNRASTLICACEKIRTIKQELGDNRLGKEKITIGLWIGREHTPNKISDGKNYLNKMQTADYRNLQNTIDNNNKFQVIKCPWCGTKLVKHVVNKGLEGRFGYKFLSNDFKIFCTHESCDFNQELPIQVIDEILYKEPPSLLFGTVDKFAMFPWKSEIGNFFASFSDNNPPDLIIQDELHLISGPLGTIVGLYESIIDGIYNNKKYSYKIVASTATIQRAKEQCASLYDRDVNQFPHPALNSEDLFFARENQISDKTPGRLYVGLFSASKTKATMQVRAISSLLQTSFNLKLEDNLKDKFWTTTLYFNSLKELGKVNSLISDDIQSYLNLLAKRFDTKRRYINNIDELTSRIAMPKLNQTLERLEKTTYSKENREKNIYATDVLLATNMISVGVDISRLNVMLMVGQPKLTSEYIQASSRVGRNDAGVVFTLYDAARSRDRSHFEQFKQYHESFYKFVEPTSVTPFSKPARDRALHSVLISIIRNCILELKLDRDAVNFDINVFENQLSSIIDFIVSRNQSMFKRINFNTNISDDSRLIEEEIEDILNIWHQKAKNSEDRTFIYGEKYMVKSPHVNGMRLLKPFDSNNIEDGFDTMTSMRNVEDNIRVTIMGEE